MGRLTWQNVDNPNFSGVAESYRTMSQLLGNAAKSGMDMVDTFTKANSDAADRQIMQRMLGVTDPSQFNAQSILGDQANKASMAMMERVGKQEDTLINRDVTRDTHAQNERGWAYTNDGRDQLAANQSQINALRARAANGDQAAIAKMAALNLRVDLSGELMTDASTMVNSAINRRDTNQRYDMAEYSRNRAVENDQVMDQMPALLEQIRNNAIDGQSGDEYLLSRTDLSPKVREMARANLGNIFGGMGGSGGGSPGETGSGGGLSGSTGLASSVISGVLDNSGTLPDEGVKWANAVGLTENESGGNYSAQNNAVGSGGKRGHFGALQFGQDRLTDAKDAGIIPRDMSPEQFMSAGKDVQDKVANWHFADIDRSAKALGLEKHYGEVINGVTINRDSIRAMAHLAGSAGAAKFIASKGAYDPDDDKRPGKTGTKISDYGKKFGGEKQRQIAQLGQPDPSRALANELETANRVSNTEIQNTTSRYVKALQGQDTPAAAAMALAKQFPGSSSNELQGFVEDLIQKSFNKQTGRYELNAPEAAAIVELNLKAAPKGWADNFLNIGRAWNYVTAQTVDDSGRTYDQKGAEQLVRGELAGDNATRTQYQFDAKSAQARSTQANAVRDKIAMELEAAVRAAAGRPGREKYVTKLQKQLELAVNNAGQAEYDLMSMGPPKQTVQPNIDSTESLAERTNVPLQLMKWYKGRSE